MTSFQNNTPAQSAQPSTSNGVMAVSLTSEQFNRIRDLLSVYSGVHLDTARQRVLEVGLAKRLQQTGHSLERYEHYIRSESGQGELKRLAELVLNHETFFFRNGPHLRALQEVLLPEIHRRKPIGAPIRMWSAGCATGEEAYTLAIVALETLGWPLSRPVEIWATDLSEAALQKAKGGVYRGRSLNNVPPALLGRYFHPHGDGYSVGEKLRSLVRFEMMNLLDSFPPEAYGIDLIFCQNVTIYFQLETCRKLIGRFHECLPPEGLLFLGFSETLWNVFDGFQTREVSDAYVYYKPAITKAESRVSRTAAAKARVAQHKPTVGSQRNQAATAQRADTAATPRQRPQRPPRVLEPPAAEPERSQADEDLLQQGRELLEQGELNAALEILRHIPPQSKCAPQALTLVARIHADRGDLDLAVAEIQRVLEIDKLNDEAYLLLGAIYGRQGQWQMAVLQFERARYLKPSAALVSFHLANAYQQVGRRDLAMREYKNTLQKLNDHPPDMLLDGVAIGWIRETCQQQLEAGPHRR